MDHVCKLKFRSYVHLLACLNTLHLVDLVKFQRLTSGALYLQFVTCYEAKKAYVCSYLSLITSLLSKNHIGVTVYLLNSLLLGISSQGYVKDIL